ncbi:MAG TPA: hypothetical protein VNM14_00780 [Planctomycetota bacterium]|nr:hypothetical protein [Planctomycetota bacterium]
MLLVVELMNYCGRRLMVGLVLLWIVPGCGKTRHPAPPAVTPIVLQTANGWSSAEPRIAMNPSGVAVAVWSQFDGTRWNVWSNRYLPGSGWQGPVLVEDDDLADASALRVAIDDAGCAFVSWYDSQGGYAYVNRSDASGAWPASPTLLASDSGQGIGMTDVAVSPGGIAVAVWFQKIGAHYQIWSRRYASPGGWAAAVRLDSMVAEDGADVSAAVDASGNAFAIWKQSDGVRWNAWVNRYTAGAGWGAATALETESTGYAGLLSMAFDAAGNAMAIWQRETGTPGTPTRIRARRYVAGVGWDASHVLLDDPAAGSASWCHLGFDGSGTAIAIWMQYDGSRTNGWSRRYVPGAGWTAPERFENNGPNIFLPELAVSADGSAVATWASSTPARSDAWASRYTPGGGWTAGSLLESDDSGNVYDPHVGMDDSGRAIVVWVQVMNALTTMLARPY